MSSEQLHSRRTTFHESEHVVQERVDKPFRFMDLPTEIRVIIYNFCLPASNLRYIRPAQTNNENRMNSNNPFFLTCSQIRTEFRKEYLQNTETTTSILHVSKYVQDIMLEEPDVLRTLQVGIPNYTSDHEPYELYLLLAFLRHPLKLRCLVTSGLTRDHLPGYSVGMVYASKAIHLLQDLVDLLSASTVTKEGERWASYFDAAIQGIQLTPCRVQALKPFRMCYSFRSYCGLYISVKSPHRQHWMISESRSKLRIKQWVADVRFPVDWVFVSGCR
jgi:hypothetical protein